MILRICLRAAKTTNKYSYVASKVIRLESYHDKPETPKLQTLGPQN